MLRAAKLIQSQVIAGGNHGESSPKFLRDAHWYRTRGTGVPRNGTGAEKGLSVRKFPNWFSDQPADRRNRRISG
jgi:hypothetical protein